MKYARIEHERRFVVQALPPHVDPTAYERIEDRYVRGTHLRVRLVHTPAGERVVSKLGQKTVDPANPLDARRRKMTTMILEEAEADLLATLPSARTVKRRYRFTEEGRTWCIDAWEEPPSARGILLAEVEAASERELADVKPPAWVEREVTDDPQYTGFALATRR